MYFTFMIRKHYESVIMTLEVQDRQIANTHRENK